jgi:hypothetical protein
MTHWSGRVPPRQVTPSTRSSQAYMGAEASPPVSRDFGLTIGATQPTLGARCADVLASGRHGLRWRDTDVLHRFEQDADEARAGGQVPCLQREPPVGHQYPTELRYRLLRPAEVRHGQVSDDRGEGAVRERERLGIGPPELGCGKRCRASPIIASAMSTPTDVAPRSAARAARCPGPQATSSSRTPGPAPTASSSGPLRRLVKAAQWSL